MNAPMHLEDYIDRVRPKAAANILLWVIVAFIVIFLIWATLTQLDRTVRGHGRIIPGSQLQTVSNLEGGIVEQILVKVGDVVKRGDPIVRLDQTQTGSAFGSNQAQYDALRSRIARLEAEVAGRAPAFPGGPSETLQEQVSIERSVHASRMADLQSLTAAGQARIVQTERAVNEAAAARDARRSAREAADIELQLIRPLVERGIEPRLSLIQTENRAATASADLAAAEAALTRAQSAVAESRASLNQTRQDWRARAAQELAQAQGEMVALRRTLPALSDRVSRTIVRSPLAGTVNRVMFTTVGGTISPGAPIAEIVPSDDNLFVEAQIRPEDIAWVRMNQRAKVNVTAYDSSVYGSLHGKVIAISPDATLNERTGETHYTVRIATSDRLKGRDGRPLDIGPGMVADVNLLGDKRSVLQYMLTPFTRLSETALREE